MIIVWGEESISSNPLAQSIKSFFSNNFNTDVLPLLNIVLVIVDETNKC